MKRILTIISAYLLFLFASYFGFNLGDKFGYRIMFENFGQPRDLYPLLFAYVMVFAGFLFAALGLVIVFITMHQIGRRFKVAVGKPTLYGFLLYLLTLLVLILNYNRTH